MADRIRIRHRIWLEDLCLPFTVGYHLEQTSDPAKPIKRQDGFISGWVFLTLILAIVTTISVGHWLTTYWSESTDKPTIQICGGAMQLLCCALFLPILCHGKVRQRVANSNQRDYRSNRPTSCRKWTKKVLPIIGITIFLAGMITLDIMRIAAYSFCIGSYQHFQEYPYLLKEAIVAILYHPIRILFTSMITVLCYMYIRNELSFYRYSYLRYMLLLLLASVAWIWLDTQLSESLEGYVTEDAYSTGRYKTDCPPKVSMKDHSNYTQYQCLCKTTDTFEKVDTAAEILYSFEVEYCLLVIECIMHMLFSMVEKNPEDHNEQGPLAIGDGGDTSGGNNQDQRPEADMAGREGRDEEEQRPLLSDGQRLASEEPYRYHMQNVAWMENSYQDRQTESTQNSYSTINPGNDEASNNENSLPSNRLTYFFIALVLGLAFAVLTSMQTISDVAQNKSFKVVYFTFKLFFHILAIAITAQGFKSCRKFTSKHRGYMGFEILTIFTSFGFFIYVFFILQANIAEMRGARYAMHVEEEDDIPDSYKPAAIIYMVDIIVNSIQVYTQSLFMLHSSKIKPPTQRTSEIREALYVFKQVILYLATCNFFIWGLESFVELQKISSIFPFHSIYYGKAQWQILSHIAYPLMIFYRFNSCIYLIGIHLST